MKRFVLILACLFLSTAHAESENLGGPSAQKLWSVLSSVDASVAAAKEKAKEAKKPKSKKKPAKKTKKKSAKKKKKEKEKILFTKIECAWQGPGPEDPCHECLAERDKKGNACKSCEALTPADPDHCSIDENSKLTDSQLKKLGAVMKKIPAGTDSAGGWSSRTIGEGYCRKGPPPYCKYSFEK